MESLNTLISCTDAVPNLFSVFDTTLAPALLYYSYIPIALLSLILGFFIFVKDKFSLKGSLFFILSALLTLNILNEIILWIATPAGIIYFGWSLSILFRILILIVTLYFSYAFIQKKDVPFKYKSIGFILFLPIVVFLTTKLTESSFDLDWCGGINGPLWFYLYALEGVSIGLLLMYFVYWMIKYSKNKEPDSLQNALLLLGVGVFLTIFILSQVFGELTGLYELNLVGPIGVLVFLMTLAYIIVKYKTFNIELAAPIALVFCLWGLVFSLLFVHTIQTVQIIVGATLILLVGFGLALIKSIRLEIKQREQIEHLARDLARANDRLRELDKAKSEFVSIASHQLRSPLTSIRGYASMLVEGSFGKLPTKATEAAARIEESSKLMVLSVEDYLNVSRIESGNMKYNLSDFNVKEMVEHICDDMRQEAMKKGLILLFRSDLSGRGIVNADVGKTNQIIQNLLNNSLKYTPKGSINVFVHDDIKKKRIYVSITDTGIGMSEKTADSLFQKFSRADNANSVNVSGTGLGLYVALKMAEQMGGTISCESEGDGKGSTFTFELPLGV